MGRVSNNPELAVNLDEAVAEVLNKLTGMMVRYRSEEDRYGVVATQINAALRLVATEADWSCYASKEEVGIVQAGDRIVPLRAGIRPRIMIDDSVSLCREDDYPVVWAAFLPREAINKVPDRTQLWVAHTQSTLEFSRPFRSGEAGLRIMVPVMREPVMFRIPPRPLDPNDPVPPVPLAVREQNLDFAWPDLVLAKAAYLYAQTNPTMQPRVQTLEAQYTDLMYALKERDSRNTDAPFMNPYFVPVENDIFGGSSESHRPYGERRWY